MKAFMERPVLNLLLMFALLEIGCQGTSRDQPPLGQVSGKVTLDGEPFSNGIVHFIPGSGRESIGMTDTNGNYTLGYLPNVTGAKIGTHKVVIATHYNDEASPEAMYGTERIPKKYNTETTLTAEVKAGKNQVNFELTSN